MAARYFIDQFGDMEFRHGGVTCVDAEKVLAARGFIPLTIPGRDDFSAGGKLRRFFFLLQTCWRLPRGSWVAFLFPVYARMNRWLIRLLAWKGLRPVCIIADIEGLRDADARLLAGEKKDFRRWSYFVVHNEAMRDWILAVVPGAKCALLSFFDFLTASVDTERQPTPDIVFAGNLEKSPFTAQLPKISSARLRFHLYGPGYRAGENALEVTHHGVYRPEEMPGQVQGSFGLIWDGESIDSCSGSYGEYLRLNTQHKLSLYILAGLPVIVWREAATAKLVTSAGIGKCIGSLRELESLVAGISVEEYAAMRTRMRPLAKKISEGGNLADAIEELTGRAS